MSTTDSLAILNRAIDAYTIAPAHSRDALWGRLMRLTAPVLEEREALLDKLERGDQIQWKRQPYERGSLRPESSDPKYQRDSDRWISWLSRLQEIEDVLASFPAVPADSTPEHPMTGCETPRMMPLPESLAQPP